MKVNKDRLVELDIPFGVFTVLFILDTLVVHNDIFHAIAFPVGVGALVICCLSVFLRWCNRDDKKKEETDKNA